MYVINSYRRFEGTDKPLTSQKTYLWYKENTCERWLYSILITNLIHWLLFIHKIIYSPTCFEPQVLIFRRIQLYTCSIWYCHCLREFLVACRCTAVYRQATRNSHREWQYHMLHVHNCILLKMSTWGSKHVDENIILWINNNQCIKLVINMLYSQFMMHGQKNIELYERCYNVYKTPEYSN